MVNEILVRRSNKVTVERKEHEQSNYEKTLLVALMKNVEAYGYTFSKELFEILSTYNADELTDFHKELVLILKKLKGADKTYNPMYPNFPGQVMEADDIELFINAIIHYWSFGTLIPDYKKEERLPLLDDTKLTVLTPGIREDLMQIFANLASSKTSLSEQDKEDVQWVIENVVDYANYLPDEIPLKENCALIGKLVIQNAPLENVSSIEKYFKTATDVLRLAVAMSDGDISLATNTKFKHFKRRERRMLMSLLANCKNLMEDMFRYQGQWIRFGEYVHPGEFYAYKYDKVVKAFNALRNDDKPLMFAGKVQQAIVSNETKTAVDLLKQRPGEFARKLDDLLRDANYRDKRYVCEVFDEVAEDISTPVLLQVRQHFISRMSKKSGGSRVFFPKGNVAKALIIDDTLPPIDGEFCDSIIHSCENGLIASYSKKPEMGKVYVDKKFKKYLVPFSQRSASKSSKQIVRGSRVAIGENANTVRAFIWWTNVGEASGYVAGRVDIDLSAAIFDENWDYVQHISYTNLRDSGMNCCYSGDFVDGGSVNGDGIAEFIDIDIDRVSQKGRYVAFQVYSFTRQNFSNLPNCRFGWMEREYPNSGEIFEPKTVEMSMDVTSASKVAIPVVFDTHTHEFIWLDMTFGVELNTIGSYFGRYAGNNFENNRKKVRETCKALTDSLSKANLYDLVCLNIEGRGTRVYDRNEADIIFDLDTKPPVEFAQVAKIDENGEPHMVLTEREKTEVPIITPYQIDYFMGELL